MESGVQTFSSPHRPMGWFGLALAAALLVLTFVEGTGLGNWALASAVVLFGAVIAVVYIRPGLVLHEDHLLVRNALSDVVIPWPAIETIGVRHVMEVDVGDRVVRALAFGRTLRQQRRHAAATAKVGEMDYTEFVVDRVRTVARERGGLRTGAPDGAAPVGSWRWLEIGVLLALAVLTLVLLVLA
jgi:hypothetical protein